MTRILLVEDNEMNRDMLSRRLARRGYEVLVAVDGEAGLDMATREMPGPRPHGHEPARTGRMGGHTPSQVDPVTQPIRVIALTAHAMAGDREKALAAGCDDFDTKPVDFERLLGKIEALLGGKAKP